MKFNRLSGIPCTLWKIIFGYILFGAFWIIFSDLLMIQLVPEPFLATFSIAKGWLFIALTALLLYQVIGRQLEKMEQIKALVQEQKQFTENLIESSAAATFILNSQHKVILWNKACEELTGIAAAVMIGTGNQWQAFYDHERPCLADIVLDANLDELSQLYSSYEKSTLVQDGLHAEGWYHNLNGYDRYILFDAAPVYDSRGNLLAAIETLTDMTAQKRSDEALQENTARMTVIMDSINALIYVADMDSYEILFVNKFGRDIWGEITGKLCWETLQEGQSGPCSFCTNDRLLTAFGEPTGVYAWEFQNTRTGNWYDCRDQAIRWSDGRLVRMEIATDISERKRAEALLRLQSAALQAAANAIVITDKNGLIEWVNPAFTELTGYSAEEAVGKNPGVLVKSGVHDLAFYSEMWATLLAGEVWRGQMMNRHKDGSIYPEGQTITPVKDSSGVITHFIAIKRDLTEHRKLEAQLRQSQKMESIGTLAGGIAHDFNNILSAIIGYGEFTLMKMAADDQLRGYIKSMLEAAERAAKLTKELLHFSRKQDINKIQVDLNLIVATFEKFLTKIIGEDITYNTYLYEEPLPVLADGNQIEQMLMNLATNARDSMSSGGTLTVATEHIILDSEFVAAHGYLTPGSFALITVSDNGEGMDEATKQRIFEPFFTTKEVGKGTGLGLSMSYGIIKQHDGYITVYSEPGVGTTFRIYLPLSQSVARVELPECLEETPVGGTETILLAEDDESIRVLTKKLLREFGYTVIEAVDGQDAVSRFNENSTQIDLIVSDLIMPKMNGKEAVDLMRKVRPEMKAIFSSGYAPENLVDKVVLDGDVYMITKPVSPRDLLRMVRKVLDEGKI
jgi:two-component system NtrC family sensor kinase